jgi:hypothetical protein
MIFTDRTVGICMLAIGCFGYLHGLLQLFTGQLLIGRGMHPWLKGFLEGLLGDYAFVGSALISILIGSAFFYIGIKGITSSKRS